MDKEVSKIMEIIGNRGKYQIFVIGVIILIWVNTTVVSFCIPFLEMNPLVSYTVYSNNDTIVENGSNTKLTYDICEKVDRKNTSQFHIDKEFENSIITDFKDGTECNKLKVSLIGTFNGFGLLFGNLFFDPISKFFKMKRFFILFNLLFLIVISLSLAYVNYYYFQAINLLLMFFNKLMLNVSLVFNNEIIDKKIKAISSGIINSGMGIGGMFYVLMLYVLKNWRYVFILSACIAFITIILIYFGFQDSLIECILNKDYEKFMKNVKKIAERNGKEKELENALNDPKCRESFDILQRYTIEDDKLKDAQDRENKIIENNIKENCEDQESPKENKIIENNKKENCEEQDSHNVNNENNKEGNDIKANQEKIYINKIKEDNGIDIKNNDWSSTNLSLINVKKENNNIVNVNENKNVIIPKKPKGNCIDLFRYGSVRKTLLLICLFWFCNGALFFGLRIGIKNLHGNEYRNSILLNLCDFFSYNFSGFFSNSKLGRRGTLQLFTLIYAICCLIMFFSFKIKTVVLVFYFIARYAMMSAQCTYYTFALESYPLSVSGIGTALNVSCNSLAGIVIPFIIEYIEDKFVFLIYGVSGALCFILQFLIPETKGKPIPDNIKEVEEKNKEKK